MRRLSVLPCLATLVVLVAACGSRSGGLPASSRVTSSTASLRGSSATPPNSPSTTRSVCGNSGKAPPHYRSIVVFSFENRTWSAVGGPGFGDMPYLRALASRCAWFADWTETNTAQNSLTQYVGQVTG